MSISTFIEKDNDLGSFILFDQRNQVIFIDLLRNEEILLSDRCINLIGIFTLLNNLIAICTLLLFIFHRDKLITVYLELVFE